MVSAPVANVSGGGVNEAPLPYETAFGVREVTDRLLPNSELKQAFGPNQARQIRRMLRTSCSLLVVDGPPSSRKVLRIPRGARLGANVAGS
jgi:hypothetical protein